MKRILSFALIFVALWLSAPVLRSAGQGAPTPTPAKVPYIMLYEDGTWGYITPTPEGPTATPTEIFATPNVTAVPSWTPGPTATPLPLCGGLTTADTLNGRDTPRGNVIVQFEKGTAVGISVGQWYNHLGTWELWYKATANGKSVWLLSDYVALSPGAVCDFPAKPVTTSLLGLHLLPGASGAVVDRALPELGNLKGIDGNEPLLQAAKSQRPDLLLVYRNLFNAYGQRDYPLSWGQGDARAVADSWWAAQYHVWETRGLLGLVDYFEVINEAGYPGSAWDNAFWLRTLDNAKSAGLCLAIYSESYGTPEITAYQFRTPVLDRLLSEECRPGKHHIIALHIYEGVAGGDWKFGRWKLFLQALGPKYNALRWYVSEYGYSKGTGAVDCAAFRADWTQAEKAFAQAGDILGVAIFAVGGQGQWSDFSSCF
jgi:hypothetical protein